MWDLIVSVPDHCLFIYFLSHGYFVHFSMYILSQVQLDNTTVFYMA